MLPNMSPRVPVQDESVYLGLGSNVGNRIAHLRAGLAGLRKHGLRLRTVSAFYLTEPDLRTGSGESMGADAKQTDHPGMLTVSLLSTMLPPLSNLSIYV